MNYRQTLRLPSAFLPTAGRWKSSRSSARFSFICLVFILNIILGCESASAYTVPDSQAFQQHPGKVRQSFLKWWDRLSPLQKRLVEAVENRECDYFYHTETGPDHYGQAIPVDIAHVNSLLQSLRIPESNRKLVRHLLSDYQTCFRNTGKVLPAPVMSPRKLTLRINLQYELYNSYYWATLTDPASEIEKLLLKIGVRPEEKSFARLMVKEFLHFSQANRRLVSHPRNTIPSMASSNQPCFHFIEL